MEYWLKVKGHPNYSVSNCGRVMNDAKGRELSQYSNDRRGYLRVFIEGKKYYVHRLVADAFFDGDHTGMDVIHIDGDPRNNHIANLEWCTRKRTLDRTRELQFERDESMNFPYKIHPIRCYECMHYKKRPECTDRPPYFYCYDGELQ